MEIYNDFLTDLINPAAEKKLVNLKLKEHTGSVFVDGLSEIETDSFDKAIEVYFTALINRRREQTVKNTLSSRSHAVFQVKLYSKDKMDVDSSMHNYSSIS